MRIVISLTGTAYVVMTLVFAWDTWSRKSYREQTARGRILAGVVHGLGWPVHLTRLIGESDERAHDRTHAETYTSASIGERSSFSLFQRPVGGTPDEIRSKVFDRF